MKKQNKKIKMLDLLIKNWTLRVWLFFISFARFQILICELQSIWRKLLVLSWLYLNTIVFNLSSPYFFVKLLNSQFFNSILKCFGKHLVCIYKLDLINISLIKCLLTNCSTMDWKIAFVSRCARICSTIDWKIDFVSQCAKVFP